MEWYRYLYVDESIHQMKKTIKQIKWNILHNGKLRNVFLITLSEHPEILLEILSSQERKKKFQPEKPLFVVGVARGHQEACHLACSIILEVYQSTGSFQVKEYLYKKHFQDF